MMSRTSMSRIVLVVLLAVGVGLLLADCGGTPTHALRYQCPMHPTYIADKPGDCPICGMRLVPIEGRAAPTTVPAYTCPMHPEVTSDSPGRCPKCGMALVRNEELAAPQQVGGSSPAVQEGQGAAAPAGRKLLFYRNPMDPTITSPVPAKDSMGMDYVPVYADEQTTELPSGVPGYAAVQISAEGLRLSGVQTAPAVRERLSRTIRAVGTVTADETRIRHVHTKIPGWVEKLFVNFTGQLVKEGQPILSIYSPELVASQEEYLKSRETAKQFASSDLPEVRKGGEDLVNAARRRLELFDVPEALIAQLERTGVARRSVTLEAPASGFVTMKDVFEGEQIEPALELFTITDLSHVWVETDFYEYEARALRLGEPAVVALPFDTTAPLAGRITYVYPTLNAETHTLKVRFEFPNPGMTLKPGMFANVELAIEDVEGVIIPDSALLDTGERQVVFVSRGGGIFEPREVKVGARAGGKAQIVAGVAAGEQVVVRANFLLDSESRLRAAIAGMGAGQRQGGGEK